MAEGFKGTCQACGEIVAVDRKTGGLKSHKPFKRWWHLKGSACRGSACLPYEQASDVLVQSIDGLVVEVASAKQAYRRICESTSPVVKRYNNDLGEYADFEVSEETRAVWSNEKETQSAEAAIYLYTRDIARSKLSGLIELEVYKAWQERRLLEWIPSALISGTDKETIRQRKQQLRNLADSLYSQTYANAMDVTAEVEEDLALAKRAFARGDLFVGMEIWRYADLDLLREALSGGHRARCRRCADPLKFCRCDKRGPDYFERTLTNVKYPNSYTALKQLFDGREFVDLHLGLFGPLNDAMAPAGDSYPNERLIGRLITYATILARPFELDSAKVQTLFQKISNALKHSEIEEWRWNRERMLGEVRNPEDETAAWLDGIANHETGEFMAEGVIKIEWYDNQRGTHFLTQMSMLECDFITQLLCATTAPAEQKKYQVAALCKWLTDSLEEARFLRIWRSYKAP
jgi:hypothetical protein